MKEYGFKKGDMKASVKDFAKPADAFSQKYDQAPLRYIERQNSIQKKEAGKLKGQDFKGRYS